jgi:hypothetical protein
MTENVKHVEVLNDILNYQSRHGPVVEAAAIRAAIAALQREAAGGGDGACKDCLQVATTAASAEPVEDDPGEFGAGIQPNPKARYWQERADFWRNHAIALGYVADDGTQRCPPADVDHATAMEGWHAAFNDASELFANAPDQRFASRASRVVTWIKSNRPHPEARGGGEAVAWECRVILKDGFGEWHKCSRDQYDSIRLTGHYKGPCGAMCEARALYTHPAPAALDAEDGHG